MEKIQQKNATQDQSAADGINMPVSESKLV